MTTFPRQDVIAVCETCGSRLQVADPLVGWRAMQAIASNESSLGANCGPRFEPRLNESSYGPWQMLESNFTPGAQQRGIEMLMLDDFADEFVHFFNRYVIGVRGAKTLEQIGFCWNAGHVPAVATAGELAYVAKLQAAYDEAV